MLIIWRFHTAKLHNMQQYTNASFHSFSVYHPSVVVPYGLTACNIYEFSPRECYASVARVVFHFIYRLLFDKDPLCFIFFHFPLQEKASIHPNAFMSM